MDLNNKVTQLEDEIKILKNEVQSVLLDLRESFLNNVNPFNPDTIVTYQASPPVIPVDDIVTQPEIESPVQVRAEEEEEILDPEPEIEIEEDNNEDFPEFELDDDDDNPVFADFSDDEPPGFFSETNGNQEVDKEEDSMVWHTESNPATQFKPADTPNPFVSASISEIQEPDLEMIARLSIWVEDSVIILGPERTRAIIDITETMGYIKPDLKNILVKFIHPPSDVENRVNVTTRDYLKCLVELNQILKSDNRQEVALLFILILCQEYDNR